MIPLPQAHFLSPWLIRVLENITECWPGSPCLISDAEISSYFGVDTHRYTPVLQYGYHWKVQVLSNVMAQIPCLYVAPYLRYSCFPQFAPVWAVQDSNDSISGEFLGKRLYLRNGATYKHGTYTILLLRTCTFQWYPYCSTIVYLRVSSPNYDEISASDIRHGDHGQHSVIFSSTRISHGDKKWACGRGIMRLPENVKISEKVPSEKKQGASSDNTSILSDHTSFRI